MSYALRGIQVSEETQERVRKVADELGYEANPIARALASGRTGMVGILGPSLEDLWQQRLVAEAGRALLAHDRYALILDAGGDPVRQRALATQLRDQQVDGLILSPVDPSDEFWTELAESLAIVSIGDALPGRGAAGEVLFDNRTGVRWALEHLHALGHRRIAVLRPPGSPTNDRPAEVYVGSEADRLGLDVSRGERRIRAPGGDRRRPRRADRARAGRAPCSASRTRSPTAYTRPPASSGSRSRPTCR